MPPRLTPITWALPTPAPSSTATISPAISATPNEPVGRPLFPQHRLPPEAVKAHALDQNQPWPPPVQRSTQLVGDPQLTAAGIPRPAHIASSFSGQLRR